MAMPDAYYYANAIAIPLVIVALAGAWVLVRWANHRFPRR